MPAINDLVAFTKKKVEPMVCGFFPKTERAAVIETLSKSVIFVTRENITQLIETTTWHKTAWDLANLFLSSGDAELLSEDAPCLAGISEETTCYVSPTYFSISERFADYVVHEAAHIFHNCKRETVGLPEKRRIEWLLPIDFRQRETFAYACEAYSRILELESRDKSRDNLLNEHKNSFAITDERFDLALYWEALQKAVESRNGWKKILEACKPRELGQREQASLSGRKK